MNVWSFVKIFFFVFDFTKDTAFLIYLVKVVFAVEAEELTSSDDFFMFGIYINSLFLGQLLLSILAFRHRYAALSICSHDGSRSTRILLYATMVIFFPVTGVLISTEKYFNERYVENHFTQTAKGLPSVVDSDGLRECWYWLQNKSNGLNEIEQSKNLGENVESGQELLNESRKIDWSLGPITKSEYEDLVTKFNYVENQESIGSFEMIKTRTVKRAGGKFEIEEESVHQEDKIQTFVWADLIEPRLMFP